MHSHKITVFVDSPLFSSKAQALATQLQLPFSDTGEFILLVTGKGIGISKNAEPGILIVDFASSKLQYRLKHSSMKKELLIRALGLKKETQPKLIDGTAGLANDGFLLASFGFEITLIEKSPIIYTLILDAINRGLSSDKLQPTLAKMHLINQDAIDYFATQTADIIYLDPMFPEKRKSALSKKEMQLLQAILEPDKHEDKLLLSALACASQRVVVKRPRLANFLANKEPNFSLTGSSSRFDVYLPKS